MEMTDRIVPGHHRGKDMRGVLEFLFYGVAGRGVWRKGITGLWQTGEKESHTGKKYLSTLWQLPLFHF